MAVGSNTYSNISSFVVTVYEAAMAASRAENVMLPLVTVLNDRTGLATRSFSEYGTASVNSIGEMDDLASQTFTPTEISTLTPGEVGAQFFLTDSRVESDPFAVRQEAAEELGGAMAEKIDTDLISLFDDLTGGTISAPGTAITWGHFYAMQSRLVARKARGMFSFVCHPYHWHQLGKAASVAGSSTNAAPDLLNDVNRLFYVATVSGVNIYVTPNVPIDANDDAYCAMFAQGAIAFDVRRAPRIEPERDASRRGWELNLSAMYAYGVRRPTWGIQGLFDATAPSS